MKARLLVAAVGIPVVIVVLFLLPALATVVMAALLCALAVHELVYATGLCKHVRLVAYTMALAAGVPVWCWFGCPQTAMLVALLVYAVLLFAELLKAHETLQFANVCVCLMAGILVPYLLSALVRLRLQEDGKFLVAIPFIVAFISDGGAYFVGRALGKHKLAPVVSPKKTIEGVIGGVAIGAAAMVIYGLVLQFGFSREVNYLSCVLIGLLGSGIDVLGDLAFSLVKRQAGIKDYGHLMPGHGGVLDRFDSMVLVAPLVEIFVLLLPVLGGAL